jgi:hypothetical protein
MGPGGNVQEVLMGGDPQIQLTFLNDILAQVTGAMMVMMIMLMLRIMMMMVMVGG